MSARERTLALVRTRLKCEGVARVCVCVRAQVGSVIKVISV